MQTYSYVAHQVIVQYDTYSLNHTVMSDSYYKSHFEIPISKLQELNIQIGEVDNF